MSSTLNELSKITIADIINILLLTATGIGVRATFKQINILNIQKRADIILQLYKQLHQDNDMQEMYYKIEYSTFRYSEEFHNSVEEKQLDKLLGLFSNIGQLYQMGIIKEIDLEFIKYEFQITYQNQEVQNYLKFLDRWFERREITHFKFQPFRDVGEEILQNKQNT